MEPEDSFFNKLHEIFDTPSIVGKLERFSLRGNERNRTLGFILVKRSQIILWMQHVQFICPQIWQPIICFKSSHVNLKNNNVDYIFYPIN